jgi:predicted aspartyl protease
MQPKAATGERKGRVRQVGKVLTTLTVTNLEDRGLARRGLLAREQVRTATLEDVLVDTGATLLCLPAGVIEQLGLPFLEEADIVTADGPGTARVFEGAHLSVEGRAGSFDCVELVRGAEALLGVIPLQALGLQPDLARERLLVLPNRGPRSYLTVL